MSAQKSSVAAINGSARRRIFLCLLGRLVLALWLGLSAVAAMAQPAAAAGVVTILTINGAIGPANADYVVRGISQASARQSQLVILQMDTPGGLDTAMRDIIKAILASEVPVASFVAPGGARAASAGTYILYASHIAAMAPGTNLGAATPVQVGGLPPDPLAPVGRPDDPGKEASHPDTTDLPTASTMTRKQVNDAAAYIRGLAQLRGRNAEWAERAVREAVSLSAEDALQQQVIDHVAADVPALLQRLDGLSVKVLHGVKTLQTQQAVAVEVPPDWRTQLLEVITNPSIALLLMSIGLYGIIFEFLSPGFGAPGVLGIICLLLALYGLQLLPVSYAGLALILLGIGFMVTEAFLPSFGIFGVGGIAAFVAGALMLIKTDLPGFGISPVWVGAVALGSALLTGLMVGAAVKSRHRAVVGGPDELIGKRAEVVEAMGQEGWVRLHGENWRVVSRQPLRPGLSVQVVARKGLLLEVVVIDDIEKGE